MKEAIVGLAVLFTAACGGTESHLGSSAAPDQVVAVPVAEPPVSSTTSDTAANGNSLGVVMEQVGSAAGFAPEGLEFEASPSPDGTVAIQLTGLGGTCGSEPAIFATQQGDTVTLEVSTTGPTARCPAHFSIRLSVGPLEPGTYDFVLAGSRQELALGQATVTALRPPSPGTETSSLPTSVIHTAAAPFGATPGLEIASSEEGIMELILTTLPPCQQGNLGFSAAHEGDQLIIRPHRPASTARCASIMQRVHLRVQLGGEVPSSVSLRDAADHQVARLS